MQISDVFEYNQHFVAMMNVINSARLNPPEGGHNHHIVPRCWFKMNSLPIDNSEDNIVLLTEEDHMKVHKLATMCIIGPKMRHCMGFAVNILHGSFRGMHHSQETRLKMSNSRKGKMPKNWADLCRSLVGKKRSESSRKKMSDAARRSVEMGGHRGGVKFKGMKWKVVNNKRIWYKEEDLYV